ncbi:hypothetical protein ACKWTF_016386 [Chironomus riparius]
MLKYINLIFYVNLILFIRLARAPLPSIFPVCFRDDPQLGECIVRAVKVLQPRLITGDLGEGYIIPKIDPFYIPKIIYGTDRVFKAILSDVYLKGMSNFNIDKLHVDINDIRFDMILSFPKIDMTANYQMIFNLFGAPLFSEGKMHEGLSNTKIRLIMKARLYNKNRQRYLKFDPFYFKILQNSVRFINFTNLFPNTILIGPIVQNYIVSNIDFFTRNIYPNFERAFTDTFTQVANKISVGATFDEAFPI